MATIGYTSIGGTTDTTQSNWQVEGSRGASERYTASTGDSVTEVAVYGAGTGVAEVAVYTYVSGSISTLVNSATVSVGSTAGWYTTTVDWSLTNGTEYVVAIDYYTDESWTTYFDTSAGTYSLKQAPNNITSSWTESSSGTGRTSFYATVTAGGTDANVSATVVTSTSSVPAPSVGAGVGVTATVVTSTASVPGPAVGAGVGVTATVVTSTSSVPGPSVGAGVGVTATVVTSTADVPLPAVSAGSNANVTATVVTSTSSVPAPAVGAGVGVTATVVTSTGSVPLPAVSTGSNANVTATVVTSTTTVPAPSVGAGVGVTATVVTSTTTIPAPSVGAGVGVTATVVTSTADVPLPIVGLGRFITTVDATNKRFLDQHSEAILGIGDTAWSLVGQATQAEITTYMSDISAKGVNLVILSAPEPYYTDNGTDQTSSPPSYRNAAGADPFTGTNFQSGLNDTYWQTVDHAFRKAAEYGITVLVCPQYSGYADGADGWSNEVEAAYTADTQNLTDYGNDLVSRYGHWPNIIWLFGHDRVPTQDFKAASKLIADRIQAQTTHLVCHGGWHNSNTTSSGDTDWNAVTGDDITTDFDTVYSYNVQVGQGVETYRATKTSIFLEGIYEQEQTRGIGHQDLREQNWEALTAGGAALFLGNNPRWHFESGKELYSFSGTWEQSITNATYNEGTVHLSHLADFVSNTAGILDTAPDTTDTFLTAGTGFARFDTSVGVVYSTAAASITVDTTELSGTGQVRIRRFDPTDGSYTTVVEAEDQSSARVITYPGTNANGDTDYIYEITLSPSASVTATVVTSTGNVPLPAVSAGGNANVTATVVTSTSSVPAPSVGAGVGVTATVVTSTSSVPAPSVGAGVGVTATVVTSTGSVPLPAVSTGSNANVTATVVTSTADVPLPAIGTGVGVTATVVTSTGTVPLPAISAGSDVAVSATVVTSTSSVPAPAVGAGVGVTATVVTSTADIPTPALSTGVTVNATVVTSIASVILPVVAAVAVDVVSKMTAHLATRMTGLTPTVEMTAEPAEDIT